MALGLRVTRVRPLEYHPSGQAILRVEGAFPQELEGKKSYGSVEALLIGMLAEDWNRRFRVGQHLQVEGQLWGVQSAQKKNICVLVSKINLGEEDEKKCQ